jgi:hypothetical protein
VRRRGAHGAATVVLSALMVLLGLAMLATTIARGGGPLATGVIFGLLFVGAGGVRLYLERERG